MSVMNAYVDDYGKITVYLSRNFFGGRTNEFHLSDEKGNSWDCIIRNVEERRDEVVYELVIPSDLEMIRLAATSPSTFIVVNAISRRR